MTTSRERADRLAEQLRGSQQYVNGRGAGCESCGTPDATCFGKVGVGGKACCGSCYYRATHGQNSPPDLSGWRIDSVEVVEACEHVHSVHVVGTTEAWVVFNQDQEPAVWLFGATPGQTVTVGRVLAGLGVEP